MYFKTAVKTLGNSLTQGDFKLGCSSSSKYQNYRTGYGAPWYAVGPSPNSPTLAV